MKDVILKKVMKAVNYLVVGIMLWWFWCALRFNSAGMIPISYKGLSTSGTYFIYVLILLVSLFLISSKMRGVVFKFIEILCNQKKLVFIVLIFSQITILLSAGRVGYRWDPSRILNAVFTPLKEDGYFSLYTNNLGILYYEYLVAKFVGIFTNVNYSKLVFVLCVLNIAIVDLCLLWCYFIIKRYNQTSADYVLLLSCVLVGISGYLLVVYTDIICWPFLLFAIEIMIRLLRDFMNEIYRFKEAVVLLIALGLDTVFLYRLKPSTVIPVIAFFIVLLFAVVRRFEKRLLILFLVSSMIIFGAMYAANLAISVVDKNQKIVKIEADVAVPMTHFIAMGLAADGGFNSNDAKNITKLYTTEQKDTFSKKVIVDRVKNYGFTGYVKFILSKTNNFMADGSWGYGREGGFLITTGKFDFGPDYFKTIPSQSFLTSVRNYVTPGSPQNTSFRLLQQILYISLIGLLLFGLIQRANEQNVYMLFFWFSLIIVGIVVFLSMFESGRSRYLLQFYPILSIMSGIFPRLKLDNHVQYLPY